VQWSLFIAYDNLGFKRRKLDFFHRSNLKNNERTTFARRKAQQRMPGEKDAHWAGERCTLGNEKHCPMRSGA